MQDGVNLARSCKKKLILQESCKNLARLTFFCLKKIPGFKFRKEKINSTEREHIVGTLLNQKPRLFFTCVLMNYDEVLAHPEFFWATDCKILTVFVLLSVLIYYIAFCEK